MNSAEEGGQLNAINFLKYCYSILPDNQELTVISDELNF